MSSYEVRDAPDLLVQNLASSIVDEEVEFLRFSGDGARSAEESGTVVTDRALISEFLEALRHANGREASAGNHTYSMAIQLKKESHHSELTHLLSFWPGNDADCFGPDFRQALKKFSDYYAGQVINQVREVADTITAVEIANHIEYITRVTSREEIAALVEALAQLDGSAFAITESGTDSLWIRMHLRDGETKDINLEIATPKVGDVPVLSPLLQQYYLQALHWHNG